MTLETAPDVLNVVEAAALLRISRNSAYELVRGGVLRSVKIGRRVLVPKAALMSFLREGKSGALRVDLGTKVLA